MQGLESLKRSLEKARVIKVGGYDYFVHPISDGIPELEPSLLDEVAEAIAGIVDRSCDRILTVEAMGIPIGTAVALRLGKPLTIVRKKRYGLEGEIAIPSRTGYSSNVLHVNGIRRGDRVAFVDDVLSTGGTIVSVVNAVRLAGGTVCDAIVIIEKGHHRENIEEQLGLQIKSLVRVEIREGRVMVDPGA